ncbi:MAG: hypothetical protein WA137_10450 [Methanothrix sp.]
MKEPSISADAILEISASELQHFFDDLSLTFNSLNDLLKDQGILRGRELAELNTRASQAVKAARSPMEKLLALNLYVRQQISHVRRAMQARPPTTPTDHGVIRQAITKIQLRAVAIVEHIKVLAEDKKEISLNSGQARQFLAGREGKPPSRRDAIRALRRAEKLCPALQCGHTPGDGRQTIRLTARAGDLNCSEVAKDDLRRDQRQRSRMTGVLPFMNPDPC